MKLSIISVYDKTEITTGAHKRHIGLLKELSKRSYPVHLFSPVTFLDSDERYYEISTPQESIIPKSIQTLLAVRRTYKSMNDRFPSRGVIIAFGFNHIYASLYLKRELGLPLVFVVRSNVYEYRKIKFERRENPDGVTAIKKYLYINLLKRIAGYVYQKADKLIVQNQEDFNHVISEYNLEKAKVEIIPNNINFFNSGSSGYRNTSTNLRSIVFVGSLSKRKGIMLLAEAVKELANENINIRLDILGNGYLEKELRSYVKTNDLESYITIHGYVSDPLEYIAEADLLVMPSLLDSFPNSVLEALSVGTPVIGSDVGGISEILKFDTLLFEPGSVESIKDKITTLMDYTEYLRAKRQCMERKEVFTFDWTKQFEEVINTV